MHISLIKFWPQQTVLDSRNVNAYYCCLMLLKSYYQKTQYLKSPSSGEQLITIIINNKLKDPEYVSYLLAAAVVAGAVAEASVSIV